MSTTAKFWDGIAEKYAKTPIKDMESYEHTLQRTASYLKQTDRVLELGCGTGTTALKLAKYAGHITASDVSPGMLAVGRRNAQQVGAQNVSFVASDASAPPEGPYDVVLAYNLLHLVDDLENTLTKVQDVLEPGGLFISKTFCISGTASWKFRMIRLVLPVMQMLGRVPFVRFMPESELDAAIERAGFELIERASFPARDARRFLVARKI